MGSKVGAIKTAAHRIGCTEDEYQRNVGQELRWCSGCKAWHPRSKFGSDATRADGVARKCREHRNRRHRAAYTKRGRISRAGVRYAVPRDGDKLQARGRVNRLVGSGLLPNPNSIACVDCGHLGADTRHEYDHHLGYDATNHESVEPVCTACHGARTRRRGELTQHRGPDGRFRSEP